MIGAKTFATTVVLNFFYHMHPFNCYSQINSPLRNLVCNEHFYIRTLRRELNSSKVISSLLSFAFLTQRTKSLFVLLRILTDPDDQSRYKCCKIFNTLMRNCLPINRTWSKKQNNGCLRLIYVLQNCPLLTSHASYRKCCRSERSPEPTWAIICVLRINGLHHRTINLQNWTQQLMHA